jgi:hypothetical protein
VAPFEGKPFYISNNVFDAAFPGAFLSFAPPVRAKFTMVYANVCGFEMKVLIKKNKIAA